MSEDENTNSTGKPGQSHSLQMVLANLLTGHQMLVASLITYLVDKGVIDAGEFVKLLRHTEQRTERFAGAAEHDVKATTLSIRQTIKMLERTQSGTSDKEGE